MTTTTATTTAKEKHFATRPFQRKFCVPELLEQCSGHSVPILSTARKAKEFNLILAKPSLFDSLSFNFPHPGSNSDHWTLAHPPPLYELYIKLLSIFS